MGKNCTTYSKRTTLNLGTTSHSNRFYSSSCQLYTIWTVMHSARLLKVPCHPCWWFPVVKDELCKTFLNASVLSQHQNCQYYHILQCDSNVLGNPPLILLFFEARKTKVTTNWNLYVHINGTYSIRKKMCNVFKNKSSFDKKYRRKI